MQRLGQQPQRIEAFNDTLLEGLQLGSVEEVWIKGGSAAGDAAGDDVQMWVVHPPGFDPKDRKTTYPLLHRDSDFDHFESQRGLRVWPL